MKIAENVGIFATLNIDSKPARQLVIRATYVEPNRLLERDVRPDLLD